MRLLCSPWLCGACKTQNKKQFVDRGTDAGYADVFSAIDTHCLTLTFFLFGLCSMPGVLSCPSQRFIWWLTWLHVCCQLLCGPQTECFFSSSTWWRRSSCHTETPGWAGSPGNPLEHSNKVGQQVFPRTLCDLLNVWLTGLNSSSLLLQISHCQPVWKSFMQNLTSDFPDSLSGISTHYG